MADDFTGGALVPRGTGGAATIINNAPILRSVEWGATNAARGDIAMAKLAAQKLKQEKEAKPYEIPALESAQGGLFTEWAKQNQDARIKQSMRVFSDPNAPLELKQAEGRMLDRDLKNFNHYATVQDANLKAKMTDLTTRGYNVGPLAQELAKKHQTNPTLHQTDVASELEQAVTQRPDLLNIDKLGDQIMTGMKEQGVKITEADGRIVDKKWSQIYKEPKYPGQPPRIDPDAARIAIKRIPDADRWVEQTKDATLQQMLSNPSLSYGKTGKQLEQEAEQVALTKFFNGRGVVEYGQNKQTEQDKKAAQVKAEKLGDLEVGTTNMDITSRYQTPDGQNRAIKGTVGPTKTYRLNKGSVELDAQKPVYVMGIEKITDPNLQKKYSELFTPLSAGGAILNHGFSTKGWSKPEGGVYVTIAPTEVAVKGGKRVTRPAGTVLPLAQGQAAIRQNPEAVRKMNGYVVSPTTMQFGEDAQENEFMKNPAFKNMKIFIPEGDAPEFSAFEQKGKGASKNTEPGI